MNYPMLRRLEKPKGEVQVRSPVGAVHGEEEECKPA